MKEPSYASRMEAQRYLMANLDRIFLRIILSKGNAHPYGIGVDIERMFGTRPQYSKIYSEFKKLERDGCVRRVDTGKSGRRRKVYEPVHEKAKRRLEELEENLNGLGTNGIEPKSVIIGVFESLIEKV